MGEPQVLANPAPPVASANPADGVVTEVGSVQAVAPLGDGVACLSESRDMELRSLALYLMLDSSGSMQESTGTGPTKWDAVTRAIRGFLTETRESDLQLGMQFFPLTKPGSKFVCTSQEDCGPDGGPCFLSTCLLGGTITLCTSNADCPGGAPDNPCVNFGLCAATADTTTPTACVLPSTCGDGLGQCEDFERTCTNATSCDPASYGTPVIEIQAVSAGLQAFDQALTSKLPEGLTPTVPALQGAQDHARAWALAHPEQTVATLLVTDGLPTDCGPPPAAGAPTALDQVLQIAAAGVAASAPIATYVIGVFQPGETPSINNVNAIAAAGGTEKAAFIDASGAVEQQFLDALRSVKTTAAPCQLELSQTDGLNFFRAELLFDAGNGTSTPLPYVEGLLGCAAKPEGWYYDIPPAQGTPQAVTLCPNVCQLVKAAPQAGISLELGCAETP